MDFTIKTRAKTRACFIIAIHYMQTCRGHTDAVIIIVYFLNLRKPSEYAYDSPITSRDSIDTASAPMTTSVYFALVCFMKN